MFEKNTYIPHTVTIEGKTEYYIFFEDGQGTEHDIEVSYPVYQEFLKFVKIERNLRRWAERHVEYSELTDESISKRALYPSKSAEDVVIEKVISQRFAKAIDNLTETQRRRFILFYEFDFTHEQIAEMEGCSRVAVLRAINRANKIIEQFVNI